MKKTMRRFLTGMVGLALCVCALTLVGCGKKPKDYGKNAIVISNYQELKTFLSDFANADAYDELDISGEGKFLVISKDIDCNGEVLTPMLTKDLQGLNFRIEGDGHTISNFKLDNTCLRDVPSKAGSSASAFKVLSLFPVSFGGSIQNLEFKDVKIELNDYDFAGGRAVQIGLVGVSASSGSAPNITEDNVDFTASKYKNIKVTNLNVDIKTVSNADSSDAKKYPFAVGGFIGLDADTTQYGSNLEAETPSAIRENIKVSNINVNVDFNGGTVMFGGISGLSNWENVSYKKCSVSGNVKIANQGEDVAPSYVRGQMGNIVSVGGLVGGSIKGEYGIFIQDCKTDIDYEIGSKNSEALVNVGKYLGMIFSNESKYNEIKIDAMTFDSSSVKLNALNADGTVEVEGTVGAVVSNFIEFNAQGEKI